MDKEDIQPEERLLAEFEATSDAQWLAAAEKLLKGKPFDKVLRTHTYEGITLEPQYRRDVWEHLEHIDELPGEGSYVRGCKAEGYQQGLWKIAQEIPYPTVEEFNEALLADLQRGQDAINILIDKAGLCGKDPDDAPGETVGRGGTSISTLADLEKAFAGVQLDCVDISIQAYNQGLEYAMLVAAYCEKHGIDVTKLTGCIGSDPLGQLAERGLIPSNLPETYAKMAGLVMWAKETGAQLRVIDVHAQAYHNAGGSAVEELAFALATGVEYIRVLQGFGIAIDDISPKMQFTFALGGNLFMEIAKLRAARMLWSRIIKEFGGNDESAKMHIHGRTGMYNKTKYDPYVNMLRTTTEAFAGIIGGVDSMHVGCFDEVVREPDAFSRRIARNQHLILAEESRLGYVTDAAGGSWYIEELTQKLAETVWQNFQLLESEGSMSELLLSGNIRKTIAIVAKQRQKNLATRKDIMVGINMYANALEQELPVRERYFGAIEEKRKKEVRAVRRDDMGIEHCAHSVRQAFLAGASIGVVGQKLRSGDVTSVTPLELVRAAEPFERLREKMTAHERNTGKKAQVFLANNGPLGQYKARADFSRSFMEVGGFEVKEQGSYLTPAEAGAAALSSGAQIIVICSTDATYPEIVPVICEIVKKSQHQVMLILAGYPLEKVETYRMLGIDEFIHVKADLLEVLMSAQNKAGVA